MGFTKLDERILQSSIMAESPTTFKVWIALLAACRENGIAYVSSVYLASICHLPLSKVDEAFRHLESPDEHSRSLADEGKRILRVDGGYRVVNYERYREFHYSRNPDAIRKRLWRSKGQGPWDIPGHNGTFGTTGGHSASASASDSEIQERRSGGEELKKLRAQADEIFDKYVAYARKADLPWPRTKPPHKIEPGSAREVALHARIREGFSIDEVLEAIDAQPFLRGDNERGWLVSFDWILKPANLAKILEGSFVKKRRGDAARRAPDDPKVGSADYGRKR